MKKLIFAFLFFIAALWTVITFAPQLVLPGAMATGHQELGQGPGDEADDQGADQSQGSRLRRFDGGQGGAGPRARQSTIVGCKKVPRPVASLTLPGALT